MIDDECGYIDKTGKIVIEPQFEICGRFIEGIAAVKIDGKWGYIDKSGKFIIEPQFDAIGNIGNIAHILHCIGITDYNGYSPNTSPEFYSHSDWSFPEGFSLVWLDKRFGYIDRTGKIGIQPQYDWASEFSGGLAMVRVGNKYGYIDATGKYIWEPTN